MHLYGSINTLDRYETVDGSAYVRHYLIDLSTALGSGNDLNGRIVPNDMQSGNEYILWGDLGATLKTAVSLGFWNRPWMTVDYPYPQYAEIGRFEAEFFSSKFPAALVNGHLASSNSDVRVGNNFSRHAARWEGFVNCWRGLFGLPFYDGAYGRAGSRTDSDSAEAPQGKRETGGCRPGLARRLASPTSGHGGRVILLWSSSV